MSDLKIEIGATVAHKNAPMKSFVITEVIDADHVRIAQNGEPETADVPALTKNLIAFNATKETATVKKTKKVASALATPKSKAVKKTAAPKAKKIVAKPAAKSAKKSAKKVGKKSAARVTRESKIGADVVAKMIRMRKDDKPFGEIAAACKTSPSSVRRLLRPHGLAK